MTKYELQCEILVTFNNDLAWPCPGCESTFWAIAHTGWAKPCWILEDEWTELTCRIREMEVWYMDFELPELLHQVSISFFFFFFFFFFFLTSHLFSYLYIEIQNIVNTVEETYCKTITLITIYIHSQALFPWYISLRYTNAFPTQQLTHLSIHQCKWINYNNIDIWDLGLPRIHSPTIFLDKMDPVMKAPCTNVLVIFR